MTTPLDQARAARSLLFVPGDRPDRFAKAAASGADAVILDLEDAVAADAKATALENVVDWLGRGNAAVVRINGAGTAEHERELSILAASGAVLMVPKAQSGEVLAEIHREGEVREPEQGSGDDAERPSGVKRGSGD